MSDPQPTDLNVQIKSYFRKNSPGNYQCTLCKSALKGGLSNIRNHLRCKHKEEAALLNIPERKKTRDDIEEDSNSSTENFPQKRKISVIVDPQKDLLEILTFFLECNLPMHCADRFGKLSLVKQCLNPFGITINRQNVRKHIIHAANNIYNFIAKETEGILISIMFDGASRYNRHVFGVNIRYAKDGKIHERVIGVLTQHDRQFGSTLAQQVKSILSKIGKSEKDVYVSCTDGARNMIKTSDIIMSTQENLNVIQMLSDDDSHIDHQSILTEASEVNNEELLETFDLSEELGSLGSIAKCGAHALQLVSRKVTNLYNDQLKPLRAFIRNIHLAANRHIFANITKPRIDNDTRWGSTFRMVEDFYNNKETYLNIQHPSFQLDTDIWEFIIEYWSNFKSVNELLLFLQKSNNSMSDCYIKWLKMESSLVDLENGIYGIKNELIKHIKPEASKFLACDALVANLIFDPRIHWTFDGPTYNHVLFKRGLDNIVKIYIALYSNLTLPNQNQELSQSEMLLRQMLGETSCNNRHDIDSLKEAVIAFSFHTQRLSAHEEIDLKDFWYKLRNSHKFHLMSKVSQTVLSAPFTQVPVERCFSTFALTLTHLRTRLGDDILNAILVAKLNTDLLENLNFNNPNMN